MADLTVADVLTARTPLPYKSDDGYTVTLCGGVLYLNARPVLGSTAVELSIALAVGAAQLGEQRTGRNPNHTTPKEADRG